jgi:hypothetical protein
MQMKRKKDPVAALTPGQIILRAAIVSFLISLGTLAVLRLLRSRTPSGSINIAEPVKEPNTITPTPTTAAPAHFTEDIIVPGVTETGEQIMRQDAEHGGSPEGV